MSSKNNKKTRAKAHAHDLEREKKEAEKRALKLQKKQLKAENAGAKRKKNKGVRLRKGLVIKGIKVTDSESRRKVRSILSKRAAQKAGEMMMDEDAPRRTQKVPKSKRAPADEDMDTDA